MSDKYYGDLAQRREQWKRETLLGGRSPEELDWRKIREERERHKPPLPERPSISLETRCQGMYFCARPGTGKTQLIQDFLLDDLDMVARSEATIVVMDPTGNVGGKRPSLIHVLTRLKRFARGGDLFGRLIYIDPLDPDYTLPINLFSVRPGASSREAIRSAIDSYISLMGGLMGQQLTGFQDPVFRYAVQVAMAFPTATLETLQDIIALAPDDQQPFYEVVFDKLHPAIQRYLRRTYEGRGPRASRQEILNRLDALNADPVFRDIFNAHHSTLDFSALLNEPKVIVINASRALGSMKQLYGRYFLSVIKGAAERRGEDALPCFVYIDECDEFADFSIADMILKLRRNRIALTLANQETKRIHPDAREAIMGVAVKFINANASSANELADNIGLVDAVGRRDTSMLVNRPNFNFAVHIAGMKEPTEYELEPFAMNKLLSMTEAEWQEVWTDIRDRYYVPAEQWDLPSPQQPLPSPSPPRRSASPPEPEVKLEASKPNSTSDSEAGEWGSS